MKSAPRWLAPFVLYGFYLLIVCIVTWPLVTHISTHFAGFVYGDGNEMAHHVWWFKHALQTTQDPFYQSLLAYPNGIEGVTVWANPLQFFPAWLLAFVLPLPTALNVTVLLTMALNGWVMMQVTRRFLGDDQPAEYFSARGWAAIVAGVAFMLFPVMQGHLGAGHAGLLVQWGVPLYAWNLWQLREKVTLKRVLWVALSFFISASGHMLQTIYVLLPLTATLGLILWFTGQRRAFLRVVLGAGISAVILGIFLIPVISSTLNETAYTGEGGGVRYSADLLAVVSPSFRHPFFNRFLDYPERVLGVNIDEGAAYIGILGALLVITALIKQPRARLWAIVALVAWVLSLGPVLKVFDQPILFSVDEYQSYITLPWAGFAQLPLFNLNRTPARFNFLFAFAFTLMIGYGVAWVLSKISPKVVRGVIALILVGVIAFEYQVFFPLPLTSAVLPSAIADLRQREDIRAVFDAPWENLIVAKRGLYLQTEHELPLIAGQVSRRTPVNPAVLTLLQSTFDPALLRSVGADLVIVYREYDPDGVLYQRAQTQLGTPTFEDHEYALFDVPEVTSTPEPMLSFTENVDLSSTYDQDVYSPRAGWYSFHADVTGDGRELVLWRDQTEIGRWWIEGTVALNIPLAVEADAFHRFTWQVEPVCPHIESPALECRALTMTNITLEDFQASPFEPITYAQGVELLNAHSGVNENTLVVNLLWQFSEARDENDIRFVHVLDATGTLVAQQDITLGHHDRETGWTEQVTISLPEDLPAGEYTVLTGWYAFDTQERFAVAGENNTVRIGSFTR